MNITVKGAENNSFESLTQCNSFQTFTQSNDNNSDKNVQINVTGINGSGNNVNVKDMNVVESNKTTKIVFKNTTNKGYSERVIEKTYDPVSKKTVNTDTTVFTPNVANTVNTAGTALFINNFKNVQEINDVRDDDIA